MDVRRRIARVRLVPATCAAVLLCGMSGCASWMSDFSPSDLVPSKETWEKMSPANIWYNMQPYRLDKLNDGPGLSSDAYYSVADPLPAEPGAAKPSPAADHP